MTDAPPLDFAMIRARSTEIKREFEAMLTPREPKPRRSLAAVFLADSLAKGNAIEIPSLGITIHLPRLEPPAVELNEEDKPDAAIRADCELLFDWWASHLNWGGWFSREQARTEVLTFVLARRGVVERPAWAESWVADG